MPAPKQGHGQPARLNRDTPFICNIRFRNDLPEPPCDPKMLTAPFWPEALAQFSLTSLEKSSKRELALEPDLGIHLGLLDIDRYSVLEEGLPLAPEDAALLEGLDDLTSLQSAQKGRRPAAGDRRPELSWLMRTSYISGEVDAGRRPRKRPKVAEEPATEPEEATRESLIAAIEASFDAAERSPVHPTDPSLTVAEVLPVLPEDVPEDKQFILVSFDTDPLADNERMARLTEAQRRWVADRAVIKSFKMEGGQQFVAHAVPLRIPAPEDLPGDRTAVSGVYDWLREYNYRVQREEGHKNVLLALGDGVATYAVLDRRLVLQKRMAADNVGQKPLVRPESIHVVDLRFADEVADGLGDDD